eukprot:728495-Amphidinium_carterae.1
MKSDASGAEASSNIGAHLGVSIVMLMDSLMLAARMARPSWPPKPFCLRVLSQPRFEMQHSEMSCLNTFTPTCIIVPQVQLTLPGRRFWSSVGCSTLQSQAMA